MKIVGVCSQLFEFIEYYYRKSKPGSTGLMGEGYLETSPLLLHAVLPRSIPASGALTAILPGQCFPVRAGQSLAIVTRPVKSSGAVVATALDDYLVLVGFEGFAVVTGTVGAGWAGISCARDEGLGGDAVTNGCEYR